jgi:hypothetical protein
MGMLKIKLKVERQAPVKRLGFDFKGHKKRLVELKPRRPKPADHDGHGNIRYAVD